MTHDKGARPWRASALAALLAFCIPALSAGAAPVITRVVAAENFYGNIVAQLGGDRVVVTSILSDPAMDPHVYESSFDDARAIGAADLVIENGGGYDDWMDKLLSAGTTPKRALLRAYDIAPTKLPDNEHVWYGVDNAQAIAVAVTDALKRRDPADSALFARNLLTFDQSLGRIREKMARLKARWNGTPVGLTETIFLYQANPIGLAVLTPLEFQKAVAEGNDPPADTAVAAERQVKEKKIKTLIVNGQTISPVTEKLRSDAHAAGIPVVTVTETMPAGLSYQDWMMGQLVMLEKALGG
jgi:zinc/manganese transport system substrate-binding protein